MTTRIRLPHAALLLFVHGCTGDSVATSSGSETGGSSTGSSTDSSSTDSSSTDSSTGTGDSTETGDPTETGESEESETGEPSECGNAIVEDGEECDDGRFNGPGQYCNASCLANVCGDGDPGPNEACDDGNDVDDDACTNACAPSSCGNGILDPGEQCEDGDQDPSDGCTNSCQFATCGDGVIWAGYEACDDGNGNDADGCTGACMLPSCGDGFVQAGEGCDDSNEQSNDGCANCVEQRVYAVAAGHDHTCALLDGGAVRCWGYNSFGTLGYGHTDDIGDDETPASAGDVDVGGVVVALAAGTRHTCALLDNHAVRCWGANSYGQLGYGNIATIGDDESPASAGDVDVGGTVTQLSAGGFRTCALLDTGGVRCWGHAGAFGYTNTTNIGDNEVPAQAGDVALGGSATQVELGSTHACVVLDSGDVRCWGQNWAGKLGYGNMLAIVGGSIDNSPANAGPVMLGGTAVAVVGGGDHTCAILAGGALRCWGLGSDGQLGYGNQSVIGDNEHPIAVGDVSVGGTVVEVALGHRHTCARFDSGAVRCFGLGQYGQLGYGNTLDVGDNELPNTVGDIALGGPAAAITAGGNFSCAILTTGALRCWGDNQYGQLGLPGAGTVGDDELPDTADYVSVY